MNWNANGARRLGRKREAGCPANGFVEPVFA